MGKPSEPSDDVGVNFRPFQTFRIAGGFVEGNAALLVGKILGMLERKIEEIPHFFRHLAEKAANDCASGYGARQRVGSTCPRVTAKHVARDLIQ